MEPEQLPKGRVNGRTAIVIFAIATILLPFFIMFAMTGFDFSSLLPELKYIWLFLIPIIVVFIWVMIRNGFEKIAQASELNPSKRVNEYLLGGAVAGFVLPGTAGVLTWLTFGFIYVFYLYISPLVFILKFTGNSQNYRMKFFGDQYSNITPSILGIIVLAFIWVCIGVFVGYILYKIRTLSATRKSIPVSSFNKSAFFSITMVLFFVGFVFSFLIKLV